MVKYLITGGAGFIGSNIAHRLVEMGENVRIIDNLSTGRMENIQDILDKIEFINGDIRNLEVLNKAMSGIDYVLHQAAIPSVPKSVENPILSNDAGINGTLNVLVAARDNKIKRVVFASSSSVYGDSPKLPKKETMPINPKSPYGITKATGELYCKVFYQLYGLETVCLRYFNVFGPRQNPESEYAAVIPRFITLILNNKSPLIYGDGKQTRDFTFVKNVIDANLLACKAKGAAGETFNIACGDKISLNDFVKMINKILGKNVKINYQEERVGDIKHSLADISKAKKTLGFLPKVNFVKGIKETIEWYKS